MRIALQLAVLVALAPAAARAGGFEILEVSPAGAGMAGAGVASTRDATATFFNPAMLATGHGVSLVAGGSVWRGESEATDNVPARSERTLGLPAVFLSSRLGPYVGLGIGFYSQFAADLSWPSGFGGRTLGTAFGLRTTTINPQVALRPFPQVAIGFGISILPTSLHIANETMFGPTGARTSGTGFGGNVGVWVRILPRWLSFGASYRSAVDVDLEGPAEVGVLQVLQDAKLTLSLPHNLSVGFASQCARGLTLALDAHVTIWSDLKLLDIALVDRDAPEGTPATLQTYNFTLRDSVGVRLGGEQRLLGERVRLRLGLGFDTTPVRRGWLGPLIPDAYRATVGLGAGYHHGAIGLDVGYALAIVTPRTSNDPAFPSTYQSLVHVVSIALLIQLHDLGPRVDLPDYKNE
jgi:long-subunit fatty acid transport protein